MFKRDSSPEVFAHCSSSAGSVCFLSGFIRSLLVILIAVSTTALSSLFSTKAYAEELYAVRGLIVAPGETIRIYLNQRIEGMVPSLLSYEDNGGAYGELELDRAQVDAHSGTVTVSSGEIDSLQYTAPMHEGFDQIILADLYGRFSDPSRNFGINIFVVDTSKGDSPAFGIPTQYPGISVENLNASVVSIPSLGQVSAYKLYSPFSFDGFEAYVPTNVGLKKNLVLDQFIFGLAGEPFNRGGSYAPGTGNQNRQQQAKPIKPDCSPMKPGESFDSYLKRCFLVDSGKVPPPNHGDKKTDSEQPKPIKPPVHIGTIPIGSGTSGGHVTGSGTVSWTPPSVTGGPGGSVTVGGGTSWTNTGNATGLVDDQEMKFRRITRQWDAVKKKWVVIKIEVCTQVFRWITIIAPPNPPLTQGPIPIGQPVCRDVKA